MGTDSIEQSLAIPAEQRLNVFALVIYIPGPLGEFLDGMRRTLVPGCRAHSHVSLLPPRPLAVEWPVASRQARTVMEAWTPFEIALTSIEVFPVTDVIYIEIGDGASELRRMHKAMNAGSLEFPDPFPYHPHITLAQELAPGEMASTSEMAQQLWRDFPGPRRFAAKKAVFVQNSLANCWLDLAEFELGGSSLKS